jgi:hypothetical protein
VANAVPAGVSDLAASAVASSRGRGRAFRVARPLVVVLATAWLAIGTSSGGLAASARAFGPIGSACIEQPGPLAYEWPVRPFDRPHPVRGNFGDPRTIYWGPATDAGLGGSFTFHNGIDISARGGTPVYAVVSGLVHAVEFDYIVVWSSLGRAFQYWHIRPAASVGQPVVAERTLLGYVLAGPAHVHLTEIDRGRAVNPLAPGHLQPFRTGLRPVIRALDLRPPSAHERRTPLLRRRVWLIADVYDFPNQPPPLPWGEMPVAPAVVGWRLAKVGGPTVVPLRTAVDFRLHLPPPRYFWRVYAAGSYQNEPVIGDTHARLPGRYLFDLTPGGLNTRRLPNGRYRLTVTAADVCGNRTSRTTDLLIHN